MKFDKKEKNSLWANPICHKKFICYKKIIRGDNFISYIKTEMFVYVQSKAARLFIDNPVNPATLQLQLYTAVPTDEHLGYFSTLIYLSFWANSLYPHYIKRKCSI